MHKPPLMVEREVMIYMRVVYPELIGCLAKNSIKKVDVAEALGISPRTLYSKLVGDTDFTLSEASTIQRQFFPDMDQETLFKRADDKGT